MNERLDELMYQSGLTASGCWDTMDQYDREAIQKFAELIIRECIDLCKRVEDGNSRQMARMENDPDVDDLLMERYDGISAGAMICDWTIGHHFGMNDE